MDIEGTLPSSQEPIIFPYPEPDKSRPYPSSLRSGLVTYYTLLHF